MMNRTCAVTLVPTLRAGTHWPATLCLASFDAERRKNEIPTRSVGTRVHLSSLILLLLLAPVKAESPLAVPVEGAPFRADLVSVDDRWQIAFDAAGSRRVVPAAALAWWGQCSDTASSPWVVFFDGSLLAASLQSGDEKHFSVDSVLFGSVRLPRSRVAGLLLHPPADRGDRDRLVDRARSGDADRVVLINGDAVAGTVQHIADGKVHLQSGVGPLDLELGRVAAILCRTTADAPASPSGAWAGFRGGTRLHAESLVIAENSLKVTLPGGIAWSTLPKQLVFLQPLGGQVVYLSDLKPEGYRHVPYLSLSWPYQVDRNVLGGMLRSGGNLYLKGLGTHSASRLTYALAEPFRRFQAELAVDDAIDGGGSVGFRVFVDGQVRYTSPTVRGGQPALHISVDVAGAKRIDLVVDFADRGDELDRADWLNARLVR